MKRFLALVCAVVMLLTVIPVMSAVAVATTYDFAQLKGYFKTQGRVTVGTNYLDMDTSSSGFEFYFQGGGDVLMGADVKCTYTNNMFLTVIVDGVKSRVEIATSSTNVAQYKQITLATGLANGYHHIEVYKQTEASSAIMTVWGVTFDGTPVVAPPDDKIVMEVVGDSISGGASNLATNSTPNASYPVYQDGTATYAYVAGEALGANVRVTQTSGYGCCGGWNADGTGLNLQHMFPYTSYWRDHTDAGLYDFNPPADIVVINLGTNDYSAAKYGKISLTNAQFKAGAINLMTMARQKNPGAKIVWCTGMMGITYQTELQAAVSELGGAAGGYFFCILPEGTSGGEGHPTVAQHATAAATLENFLRENCLPADYAADFATADELKAKIATANTVSDKSAALSEALTLAQMEIDCGTTDKYRLGYRLNALTNAIYGTTVAVDFMPVQGVTTAPNTNGHYVWPYYADPASVTLYKGGEGTYWPYVHTEYSVTVDLDATPYLKLDTVGTAEWNIHIAYVDKDGIRRTVTAADIAGVGVNFPVPATRTAQYVDFGSYIKNLGHADANGNITVVGADIYVVGNTDTYVKLFACALTEDDGKADEPPVVELPTAISGSYTVENGVLADVAVGVTSDALIAAMNDSGYLRVIAADGSAVSGKLATGMKLQLVVNDSVVDEATISVLGDVNGDGDMTTADAREVLMAVVGIETLTEAQLKAGDRNGSNAAESSDARDILLTIIGL